MVTGYPVAGEVVGGYRVGRRLGVGGMGLVFEAEDPVLRRPVALKVMAAGLGDDAEFRARFTREAQAQASLSSPHVVSVYAHGEDDGRLWIASQLVPDGDLRTMLDLRGAPPLRLALDIIGQVADGLADAHAAGLIHRDIKPSNVLLGRRGDGFTAYLADFGIVRQLGGELTRTGHAPVGTPSYMAPELHTGGVAGVPTDIYSLGCLLWAALTGQTPYAGTSEFEVVMAHREQPVPQLAPGSLLARPLNDLLRTMLAKDPARRPASVAAVRDRLRQLSVPDAAPPATPALRRGPRRGHRSLGRSAAAAAFVVLVAAGGGAAAYVANRGDDAPPAGSGTSPSTSAPLAGSPSSSASTAGTYQVRTGDEDKALESMAEAFYTAPRAEGVPRVEAKCYALTIISRMGLQRLVDIGMFGEEMTYHRVKRIAYRDLEHAYDAAAADCHG